jgi:hypothetical protein
MSANTAGYLARQPRHPALPTDGLRVYVERSAGNGPSELEAELLDLSRHGLRIGTSLPLDAKEAVTVHIEHQPSGTRLVLPAVVRWQRGAEDVWSAGCQLDEPLAFETLGELFLNDILAVETD